MNKISLKKQTFADTVGYSLRGCALSGLYVHLHLQNIYENSPLCRDGCRLGQGDSFEPPTPPHAKELYLIMMQKI